MITTAAASANVDPVAALLLLAIVGGWWARW